MDFHAYLQRINYAGSLAPNAETLRLLHLAHLRTVPFENLSIHTNEPIVLDDDALLEKIVVWRRGGFCYELNGLFAALLRELGFEVKLVSAQVARADGGFSPDFDHMALLVGRDELWLADVGFGDSFLEPVLVDEQREQVQGARIYRILRDGDYFVLRQRAVDTDWKAQYRFTLRSYQYTDFAKRCRYHQTSPESHFTQSRLCSRATPEGRVTLSGMRFITTGAGDARQEQILENEEEQATVLLEQFGIVMNG
jgi:N-hydroxyarylamine O-acetyltransferase